MLKCLFMKRKLYDYLDNGLSDVDRIKVENHINICAGCRERLGEIRDIIELAAQRRVPEPSEEFWHNFKTDLDRRLSQRLVSPFDSKRKSSYFLKPVLAYALAVLFFVAIGSLFYKNYFSVRLSMIHDDALVNEVVALEELGQSPVSSRDKDAYMDDINLFYQFDQNPA